MKVIVSREIKFYNFDQYAESLLEFAKLIQVFCMAEDVQTLRDMVLEKGSLLRNENLSHFYITIAPGEFRVYQKVNKWEVDKNLIFTVPV